MAKMFCLWCKYETQCVLKALCTLRKALCKDNLPIFYYDYFVLKAVKKTGELLRKREITSLCCITLLTLDLTVRLRDHSFDLRGRHVREMM